MPSCPHCGESVDAKFQPLRTTGSAELSSGEYVTFQVVCPECDAILGGAIMSKVEDRSIF
jgi:predicted RNA-binding Zn-ribbon protein involved in translation (DUF1610 family)